MDKIYKERIYWKQLKHGPWAMYMAATKEGLCYVGSQSGSFEELVAWGNKVFSTYILIEDEPIMKPYTTELIDYLRGRRKNFTLPIDLYGTDFQQAVWKALQEIPYGQTVTYIDIAKQIKNPNAVRAVGSAIGANPVLIINPCHRVIGKNGKLTGYRGGLEMKEQLLRLEQLPKNT